MHTGEGARYMEVSLSDAQVNDRSFPVVRERLTLHDGELGFLYLVGSRLLVHPLGSFSPRFLVWIIGANRLLAVSKLF